MCAATPDFFMWALKIELKNVYCTARFCSWRHLPTPPEVTFQMLNNHTEEQRSRNCVVLNELMVQILHICKYIDRYIYREKNLK